MPSYTYNNLQIHHRVFTTMNKLCLDSYPLLVAWGMGEFLFVYCGKPFIHLRVHSQDDGKNNKNLYDQGTRNLQWSTLCTCIILYFVWLLKMRYPFNHSTLYSYGTWVCITIFIQQFWGRWWWSIGILKCWLSAFSSSEVTASSILRMFHPRLWETSSGMVVAGVFATEVHSPCNDHSCSGVSRIWL